LISEYPRGLSQTAWLLAAVPFPLIFIRHPKSQFRLPSLINNVCAAAEDPEASHSLRIHLQMLDLPAGTNQTQSAPENAGTKQLAHATR